MDSFGWGKTRKVISTDDSSEGPQSDDALGNGELAAGAEKVESVRSQAEGTDRMEDIAREEKKIGA